MKEPLGLILAVCRSTSPGRRRLTRNTTRRIAADASEVMWEDPSLARFGDGQIDKFWW